MDKIIKKIQGMNKKIMTAVLAGVLVVIVLTVLCIILIFNNYYIDLNEKDITVEYGDEVNFHEITADYKGRFYDTEGVPVEVTFEGEVDTTKVGEYEITCQVNYKKKRKRVSIKVKVEDSEAPAITLAGDAYIALSYGGEYVEPGVSATDNADGDLTSKISTTGAVDTSKVGKYTLTYSVSDESGNEAYVTREVEVIDMDAPSIEIAGSNPAYVYIGTGYTDEGASATDALDGDLSSKITVKSNVDISKRGVYTVNYEVADSAGNTASADRTVYVYDVQSYNSVVNPGDKVVYLTFDDGPSAHTQRLLDVLDKYNVKATFFVTAQFGHTNLIGEEARRGHTVAIHTYTHNYENIYSSETAFFEDLNKMSDIIEQQTGKKPTIIRFPGGSSNAVSAAYSTGIMTRLSKSVKVMGYRYFDWNVSSGDAGSSPTTSSVFTNVTEGISSHNVSVVLQHDTKGCSVDAVEQIIVWGLSNGYTFLPLTENSPVCEHGINN